ncbi:target of Nesh-SH3-like isoform X2 [Hippoglossus hippoglossus]|uniref:target of Nesh-SH3-like isoform X2 n=1 Tax=Hippoglossus hippoglossus TaxID=8267 RepID=UPI00148E185C|nr:target of Nesh-SH3-like isoform X2 [Hippoglossus hippoglossus]XP_035006069.1 target of Nesh-SH3 isoform X2 [Hippoglossus stenolepis]
MASILLLLLVLLLLSGTPAQRVRVGRQNMKVRINATGDTIVMKFVRPNPGVKLEGYILGYGSSLFSKQFIQLPENGRAYEAEMDAEPKYLVAVQPIPVNDVKKHCTGKVNLEKPLHLVIGSVSPTAVLLSWGNYLKTPYEGNVMNECLEDGFYTIRYRERNRKWNYQTCPTSDTVIDNLKPNTPYEFGVRSNKDDRSGSWSKPVVHNTNMNNKNAQKTFKLRNPLVKPLKPHGAHALFPPRPALHNRTQPRLSPLKHPGFPGAPRTSFDEGNTVKNDTNQPTDPRPSVRLLASKVDTTAAPLTRLPPHRDSPQNAKTPTNAPEKPRNPAAFSQSQDGSSLLRTALTNERARTNSWGQSRNFGPSLPLHPYDPAARSSRPAPRNPLFPSSNGFRQPRPSSSSRTSNSSPTSGILGVTGHHHRGISPPKPALWHRHRLVNNSLLDDDTSQLPDVFGRSGPGVEEERFHGSPARPLNKRPNLVGKPGETDKVNDFKLTDKLSILKPKVPPASTKPERRPTTTTTTTTSTTTTTTTVAPTPATRQETWEDSDLFKSQPTSEIDAMGNKRFVAPHVVYQTGKKPDEPCSITSSLSYFPENEHGEANATAPPKTPPSNLTVVTVEGCPSFIILDWEKTDNDTTEYEVISTAKGPDGEQVSILTTNQTHTAVENLKPESSYEFKVKPKNDLGSGPSSEPVSFNTESADPRVSENVSGKDAIWTQFPFKTDSYSDCHGKQYVKRTWYRKFVGVQLCNSLRYKIYLSDSLNGKFYNIGDQTGFGEDHCQFVDSFLDGRTGRQLRADQLPSRPGFYRAVRQEPVHFGQIGGHSHVSYVSWYECGTPIPGKW